MRHCALVSCTPSPQLIGLNFKCALFWWWVPSGAPFIISLIKFCHDFRQDSYDYYWDFMAIHCFLNYAFRVSVCSSASAIARLPGCFRPGTYSLHICLNMLPSDSFMSCLLSLLGFSTGQFQNLQLNVLAAFRAVDQPLAACMLVHFLQI